MYVCYGISNGPYIQGLPLDREDENWLWYAPLGCSIAVENKDDLVLTVPLFDWTEQTAVKIKLSRKGSDVPLVEFWQNSFHILGNPTLVWGEWRE